MKNKPRTPQKQIQPEIQKLAEDWANDTDSVQFDKNGSYTGITEFGERPVQDADDL